MKISKERLVNIYRDSYKNFGEFKGISDFIADIAVTEDMSDRERNLISESIAIGMGMGSSLDKSKHMTIGCIAGVIGTGLAVTAYNKFKKKEVVVDLRKLVDELEPILKKDLEELNNDES